jgi:NAD(P)-dependent dehydrogenase (short-subunit alcohol dehydrogenase family)
MEKTALITGAGRGLGYYLAKECIKRGYTVFAMVRNESEILKKLREETGKVIILNADVTDYNAISECRKQVEAVTDHLDLLINNSAVWLDSERLQLDDKNFDFDMIIKEFDINAVGPLRIIREYLDMVKKSENKLIINISSEAGSHSMHCWRKAEYAYCMSKASLNYASQLVEFTYKDDGIKVYAVDPGWMKTDMGGDQAPTDPTEVATDIMDLAEGERKAFIFCDRKGNKYEW